ncbi:MAG: AgmX/PglI C-terminal domain-containing protein [Proteobacteria bacterium]|nr:AgmX/PglI C-terminal domain-containing protein [Pseudomonadota bacterium]
MRFLIGLKGKVEATEAEQNTFKDKTVFNCLKTKMNAWVFPKPRGGERVSIAYPFEFKTVAAPKTSEAAPASSPSEAVPAAAPSQQAPEKTSKTQD